MLEADTVWCLVKVYILTGWLYTVITPSCLPVNGVKQSSCSQHPTVLVHDADLLRYF